MESSTINQPHPDDTPDEAEAFFGSAQPEPQDPGEFEPNGEPQEDPPFEPDPTPAEPAGTTGSTTEPQQQAPAQAQQPAKQSGSISREYIVFHRLPLTKNVLEHLLRELESGDRGGEPRFAFFEIHRAQARNATDAVAEGYQKHQERLGDTVDMAAVSEKAFQKRHIAPKEVKARASISIT